MTVPSDPPISSQDRACAVLARAALFPMKVEWSGKHRFIFPALQALDLVRKDSLETKNTPFSSLFPRHVMLVPLPTGEMQWSGQPEINDSTVEAIPNTLIVKCMECSKDVAPGKTSFVRSNEQDVYGEKKISHEIVLCSNRLLQSDYSKSKDPTLLEQRKDLPPKSLAAVEEALAHQITKARDRIFGDGNKHGAESKSCEKFAELEVQAARVAECMYQKEGNEIRRGSALGFPGYSLLPGSLRTNLQNKCIRSVVTKSCSDQFGEQEGKKCVESVM